MATSTVETTNHATTGLLKESLVTLITITYGFEINWLPADTTHVALRADALSGVLRNFKLKNVGETTGTTFAAIIKNWSMQYPVDKQATAKFDIEIVGTWTAPA